MNDSAVGWNWRNWTFGFYWWGMRGYLYGACVEIGPLSFTWQRPSIEVTSGSAKGLADARVVFTRGPNE